MGTAGKFQVVAASLDILYNKRFLLIFKFKTTLQL